MEQKKSGEKKRLLVLKRMEEVRGRSTYVTDNDDVNVLNRAIKEVRQVSIDAPCLLRTPV